MLSTARVSPPEADRGGQVGLDSLKESVAEMHCALVHDLNNMLMVIRGHCDGDPERRGSAWTQNLRAICQATDQAILLARQMQNGQNHDHTVPQVTDLNALLRENDGLIRSLLRNQHEMTLDLDTLPCPVQVGAGQVERVLANLTINSREGMSQPGHLRINTRRVPQAPSGYGPDFPPGANYVIWSLQDTGRGLDERIRPRLFQPYTTTKGPGRGLGLAIVHALVEEWGGKLEITSHIGLGTTIRIVVPLVESPKEHPVMTSNAVATDRETILLVEDENLVRAIFSRMLHACGYFVIEAANANEALILAKDFGLPIHLLVTDLALPRTTGTELAEQLKHVHPETKVLLLSGYGDGMLPGHQGRSPSHPFLQKPCTTESFLNKVREVLAS